MLSISNALKGADCGEYYLRISSEEYYARSGSERGKFFGGAVGSLVQSSEFNQKRFVGLLEGFDERGMALVQNAGHKDRWRGWDLTLSAPKSVSVLWALSSKKCRRLIRKAHDRAVRDALRWIEEHHCITRRGKGGSIRENARVLFALFFHFESRLQDPQLHTHSLLLNVAMRADGSTGALHSVDFFRAKMEAGEIYRKALKSHLFSLLWLSFVDEENGFRIVGIPQAVCSHFSKRRADMEKKMAELGLHGPVAAKNIARRTRKRKVELQKSTLFQRWRAEAEQCGWGPKHARILLASGRVQKRWEKRESRRTEKAPAYQETQLERVKRRAAEMLANAGEARDEETKSVNSVDSRRTSPARQNFPSQNSQRDKREENSHSASNKNSVKGAKKTASRGADKKKRKKWGRVIWRNSWLVNEVRLQERYIFPNAPAWTGLNKLAERRFRVVTGPPVKEKATVWEGTIGPLKTQITTSQAFGRSPVWSPGKHVRVPKVSFTLASESAKNESKSATHGHSH